ncbi:hypothetical protein [Kordia sp.]|uniref:hypothetical protein n=1 Tax=Kordia sp. TaxID=1965332 RepID=UPI0025C39CA0|nr:hypothetical protein [Kordia sp.]MCH2196059.1 hypothetical protein [Kordia sp.]
MKKSIYIAIFSFVSMVCISCTSESKPEDFASKKAFGLLQKMNTMSQEEFNSHFISLNELREIVKDTAVNETFRNAITRVSKEIHNNRLQQSYTMIKESGKRFEIDWKDISFKEYPYVMRDEENALTFQDGFLAFDYKEKKLVAKIVSIQYKDKKYLFNFSNIEPVRKQ